MSGARLRTGSWSCSRATNRLYHNLAPLVHQILTEHPDDSVEFLYEEVTNALSMGYYATLTVEDDGTVTESRLNDAPALTTLHQRLGPSLVETGRPADERGVYGGP